MMSTIYCNIPKYTVAWKCDVYNILQYPTIYCSVQMMSTIYCNIPQYIERKHP